jgi:cytosine/adenosine deaminase-related metal-dependent hydrolase
VGDNVNVVHGNDLTDDRLRRFVDLGVSFAVTVENEMSQGHGPPISGRLRDLGAAPALGVDLEISLSGDMMTQSRIALGHQRALDNAASRAHDGKTPDKSTITISPRSTGSLLKARGCCACGTASARSRPACRRIS